MLSPAFLPLLCPKLLVSDYFKSPDWTVMHIMDKEWCINFNFFATDSRNVNSCSEFFRASVANILVLIGTIFRLRHHRIRTMQKSTHTLRRQELLMVS